MNSKSHTIKLNCETESLVETALAITGKVEITKENQMMEIPVKGKVILDFSDGVSNNQIIFLQASE